MPRNQHLVRLPRADRRTVTRLVRTGRQSAWTLQRARILLLADAAADGPAWTDAAVAPRTVARARSAWCAQGLACTDPPPGFARWSLRRLTARVVELGMVETVSHETIRQALTKGGCSHGARSAS